MFGNVRLVRQMPHDLAFPKAEDGLPKVASPKTPKRVVKDRYGEKSHAIIGGVLLAPCRLLHPNCNCFTKYKRKSVEQVSIPKSCTYARLRIILQSQSEFYRDAVSASLRSPIDDRISLTPLMTTYINVFHLGA